MDSNHPYADVNPKRQPEELLYDTVEIKWGYLSIHSAT